MGDFQFYVRKQLRSGFRQAEPGCQLVPRMASKITMNLKEIGQMIEATERINTFSNLCNFVNEVSTNVAFPDWRLSHFQETVYYVTAIPRLLGIVLQNGAVLL